MSDLLGLCIASIIAIVAAIASFLEKSNENKVSNKKNFFNFFTFVAIFGGIVIAFISGYNSINDKKESDKRASEFQSDLQKKSDLIISIEEENKQETKRLNDSLAIAKTRIINLQKEINENIIGSQDPCFIIFQTSSDKKGYTVLVNEGKKPIHGLDIYLTDFIEMMKCKQSLRIDNLIIDEPCYKNCTKVFSYPLVKPGPVGMLNYSLPDTKDEFLFEIRLMYNRNIEYLEQLICKRNGNDIKCLARLLIAKNNRYEFLKIINPSKVDWKVDFDKLFNIPRTQRAFAPIFWK